MAANISHKLKNAFEGALAGGGDPATSPLYVFGPFLKILIGASIADALGVSFGASLWMVVLTIAVVSAMYRLVMQWVTDGSGGSGLSEEEFGSWAVKINAAITFIEYTLTFLVSMAAMVTFIADRFPALNEKFLWMQYRDIIAVLLSILVGYLVNRGPKMAARIFGPATAGVLALLWVMVIATIWKRGLHLPDFNLQAFSGEYLGFTIGAYVRILAVMTGIEVFANLVAAYDGEPAQRSRKAFNSLLIIMGTTAVTMLVVGPAIRDIADINNHEVSVFTQTMDALLPAPLPFIGTLIGIAVLMSASAAAAQGLQNLSLGLRERRYIPPVLGERNIYGVADKPVWIQVVIVAICFVFIGTHEETYLAIYAAGVFILLSMTGWAVTKRLFRMAREDFKISHVGMIIGTILASILTTIATGIIFKERFAEGAWTYLLFIPMLYVFFSYFRKQLGEPSDAVKYLARLDMAQLAGFGFGQSPFTGAADVEDGAESAEIGWQPEPIEKSKWRDERIEFKRIATLLDGSDYAAEALPYVKAIAKATGAELILLSAVKNNTDELAKAYDATVEKREMYLAGIVKEMQADGVSVKAEVRPGFIADATKEMVQEHAVDLVVTSTRGKSGNIHWLTGGVSSKLMRSITTPVLLVQNSENTSDKFKQMIVTLDGSIFSERVLPYARALTQAFDAELTLLSVPVVPEVANYRAPAAAYQAIREHAEANMDNFLDAVARSLREDGLKVNILTEGSRPLQTIKDVSEKLDSDLVMMTSRGRGGLSKLFVGSVAERLVEETDRAVLMVPIHDRPDEK